MKRGEEELKVKNEEEVKNKKADILEKIEVMSLIET